MDFETPSQTKYTIYSKSGCPNCTKAKKLIENEKPEIIDCDEYLIEDKQSFLEFMEFLIGKDYRIFPMIFHKGAFIGGYKELEQYVAANKKIE